jgi:hypothetical protein
VENHIEFSMHDSTPFNVSQVLQLDYINLDDPIPIDHDKPALISESCYELNTVESSHLISCNYNEYGVQIRNKTNREHNFVEYSSDCSLDLGLQMVAPIDEIESTPFDVKIVKMDLQEIISATLKTVDISEYIDNQLNMEQNCNGTEIEKIEKYDDCKSLNANTGEISQDVTSIDASDKCFEVSLVAESTPFDDKFESINNPQFNLISSTTDLELEHDKLKSIDDHQSKRIISPNADLELRGVLLNGTLRNKRYSLLDEEDAYKLMECAVEILDGIADMTLYN